MRTIAVLVLLLVAGCASPAPGPAAAPDTPRGALSIASPAFQQGAAIPVEFTCDGAGVSPPLAIAGVPTEAADVALVVGDPDAPFPQAPQQNFTHWVVWHLTPVDGNVTFDKGKVPEGAKQGQNGGGSAGWTAPCPPVGSLAHRYVFTAYALRAPLDLPATTTRAQLDAAMQGKVLASASLTGTYMRALPVTPP